MSTRAANGSCYDLLGPADAPALALIHGLGLNRRIWEEYLAPLAQHYRVLNYDLYGHGDSRPLPAEASLGRFATQLAELLDEVDIPRATLIGFSLGGMINRRLAIDQPERVESLVILNSPHERGAEAQRLVEQRAMDSAAGGPAATLDAAIERWFTPAFRAARPDYLERVRDWLLANDDADYAACRRVLAFGVTELIRPRPPITQPALIMTGANDSGSTPAMSHAIGAEIDGSTVVVVPGLQHMGLVEQPRLFLGPIGRHLQRIHANLSTTHEKTLGFD